MIELLVVIAIIGILASVVMVGLEEGRQKSRNAARVTQIKEYQKAFEMFYSANGRYPCHSTGACPATQQICLGNYPPTDNPASGTCWQGTTQERAIFVNSLVPEYMSAMSLGETRQFGQNGWIGMVYNVINAGQAYGVQYFMEGNDRDCILSGAASTNSGPDTLCTLVVTP